MKRYRIKSYAFQWRALVLMILSWSVIGLVHNGISSLFPYFSEEFHLNASHNGFLTGTLAFFWTVSIVVGGPVADKIGQMNLMIPSLALGMFAFFFLGFSQSVAMLYVLTALAGLGCGVIVPASLSFLAEQSDPKNRGLFYGSSQASYTLIGSAVGSVVFTRLSAAFVGWRGSYILIALLMFAVVALLFGFGRRIPRECRVDVEEKHSFSALLKYKNVVLSTVLASLSMMWYFTVAAYTILYLMETKNLNAVAAGAIFAGFGGGGFIGEFCAPFISDRLGRKLTMLIATALGCVCFLSFVLLPLSSLGMTATLAGASCFMSGVMAILNSVVPSESVPKQLVATATAFTPACGELMGGVVAPVLAGVISGLVSVAQVMHFLVALPVLVLVGLFFLKETAPVILMKREKKNRD